MRLIAKSQFLGVLLAFFIQSTLAYRFASLQEQTNVIPNHPNKLHAPFITETDTQDKQNSFYFLQIKCSQETKTFFKFAPFVDFCDDRGFKGSARALNEILRQVKFIIPPISESQLGDIKYYLWRENSTDAPKKFVQKFKFETHIKTEIIKNEIEFTPGTNDEIEETILLIDKRLASALSKFELNTCSPHIKLPDWLRFKIVATGLVVYGTPPLSFEENIKLHICLRETSSGLASEISRLP